MLQKINLVAYRKALELNYDYLCRIIEKHKVKNDNGSVGFIDVEVLKDIPCRLSFKTTGVSGEFGLLSNTEQIIKLFITPDIVISANSKLFIRQKTSEVEKEYSKSSEPKVYSSHQEIELKLVKEYC